MPNQIERIESIRKEKQSREFDKKVISDKFVVDFKINLFSLSGEHNTRY